MKEEEVLGILKDSGALLEGHFQLSSGLHSAQYIQCALVLAHPEYSAKLCGAIAERFKEDRPTVVVGPALGGIVVSYEVARALGVRSIFAERENGVMTLRRGFSLDKKGRALVVEDVVTTGGSVKEVVELVKNNGVTLVGLGAIADRSGGKAKFDCKFESLAKLDIETFKPEDCPLCKKGSKATKPGSRK